MKLKYCTFLVFPSYISHCNELSEITPLAQFVAAIVLSTTTLVDKRQLVRSRNT